MKEITAYQTKDGKQFFSKKQAEGHNHMLIRNELFKAFTKQIGSIKFEDKDRLLAEAVYLDGEWTVKVSTIRQLDTPA